MLSTNTTADTNGFAMAFARLRVRCAAAQPPREVGPSTCRPLAVRIDGLCWAIVGDAEPCVLWALRRDIAARLGGQDRLERRYSGSVRVGYLTHVRHRQDADWLRLRVALLAESAGLRAGVLRVAAVGV